MTDKKTTEDRWNPRPIVIPVAAALFAGATFSLLQVPFFEGAWVWFGLACILLGVPAFLIWLAARLVHLIAAALRRLWRLAFSQLVSMVVVLPLVVVALFVGPYVHFAMSLPYYLWQVQHSVGGGTAQTSFYWGGAGFVGTPQTDRWLVYDPTDETAARPKRTPDDADPTVLLEVRHLIGRFYLVERHQP